MNIGFALVAAIVQFSIIGVAIVVIVRGLSFPLGLKRTARPVCGVCKHEVAKARADQEGMGICPECGVAYETGGVLTRALALRYRPGMVSVLLSVTLLALIALMVLSGVLESMALGGGQLYRQQRNYSLEANRDDAYQYTNEPGYLIDLDVTVEARQNGPAISGTVMMIISADGGGSTIAIIDLPGGSWRASGLNGDRFDEDAAISVLGAAGVDTDPEFVHFEANQLVNAISSISQSPDAFARGQANTFGKRGYTPTPSPRPNTWQPTALRNTGHSRSVRDQESTHTIEFEEASRLQDNPGFDGEIKLTSENGVLTRVVLRVRDPVVGTAVVDYDPVINIAEILGIDESRTIQVNSHRDAIQTTFDEIGRAGGATTANQIDELADLISTIKSKPDHFNNVVNYSAPSPQARLDGVPDGGLISRSGGGSSGPVRGFRAIAPAWYAAYAAFALVYAGCIAAVVIRRRRMRSLAMG
jgi:hypothetical protein